MNRPSRKQALRTVPFDAAEYLVDEETQLAYLNAALAEGDAQAMVTALGTAARAVCVGIHVRDANGAVKASGIMEREPGDLV